MNPQLKAAYAVCRDVARAAARNFYYAFLVLPGHKRNALCAVYAFMRHADDISDDPELPPEEKRERLLAWGEAMHRVVGGQPTDDPVLLALADTQREYGIDPRLFSQLVQGTAMDLPPALAAGSREQDPEGPYVFYERFEDLREYCYFVASVVGLICIKVFGYRDAAAERMAERCGLAFQLTNIIRDVREDAAMGRVYIPAEDLRRYGVLPRHLRNGMPLPALQPVLQLQADRAREFYRAGDELLELIDHDSRAALWVLISIYRRLLEKIAARDFDVFKEKIALSPWEKLSILGRGFLMRLA